MLRDRLEAYPRLGIHLPGLRRSIKKAQASEQLATIRLLTLRASHRLPVSATLPIEYSMVSQTTRRRSYSIQGISMKRDHVLVYKLLCFVEEKGHRLFKGSIPIEGYERDEVISHLYLVADAGFVELGQETLANKGPLVLTWKGCDYLDALRAKMDKKPSPNSPSA